MLTFVREMQRKADINSDRTSKFLNYWKLINMKDRPNMHTHTPYIIMIDFLVQWSK